MTARMSCDCRVDILDKSVAVLFCGTGRGARAQWLLALVHDSATDPVIEHNFQLANSSFANMAF